MSQRKSAPPNEVLQRLKKAYPNAKMVLSYSNNWELLVAVMLSAQCTDKTVNKVTPRLFATYKTVKDYRDAPIAGLESLIRSTGFYHNKAKNIQLAAKIIIEKFNAEVPKTMTDMLTIPGVARKTANVVLGNAYHVYEGIAVDTHVKRLSGRLGFSKQNDPEKIEKDLMQEFAKKDWFSVTYLLIEHGRTICDAKKPLCDQCILSDICPSAFQFLPPQRDPASGGTNFQKTHHGKK